MLAGGLQTSGDDTADSTLHPRVPGLPRGGLHHPAVQSHVEKRTVLQTRCEISFIVLLVRWKHWKKAANCSLDSFIAELSPERYCWWGPPQ